MPSLNQGFEYGPGIFFCFGTLNGWPPITETFLTHRNSFECGYGIRAVTSIQSCQALPNVANGSESITVVIAKLQQRPGGAPVGNELIRFLRHFLSFRVQWTRVTKLCPSW